MRPQTTGGEDYGRRCFVGPYGWTCDDNDVEQDEQYYQWLGPDEGELGATPVGVAPLCMDS